MVSAASPVEHNGGGKKPAAFVRFRGNMVYWVWRGASMRYNPDVGRRAGSGVGDRFARIA
jgi:hypothetical protein